MSQTTHPGWGVRTVRATGWLLISLAAVIGLYVFWSLVWTNVGTGQAQGELADAWELALGPDVDGPALDVDRDQAGPGGEADIPVPSLPGDMVARLRFSRPGSDERPLSERPLYVVEGTGREELKRGPGRYTHSALPGEEGNFAVAGHRTTYGAPFFSADELLPGDQIEVTDTSGERHVYDVVGTEIVAPGDTWVVADDPLESGRPMLTLTTCHPRFSAAQRMIVFAELSDA